MASLKAILSAGAILFGAVSGAQAADLLPPPPPPVEPVYAPSFNGWYIRGDVGEANSTIDHLRSSFAPGYSVPQYQVNSDSISAAAIIGLGAGYQFNNWFRADVTGEYRTGASYRAINSYGQPTCTTEARCYDGYTASISSAVFLANGYVDVGTWYGVTPYFGAGVGVADVMFKGLTDTGLTNYGAGGVASDNNSAHFAWALMTGISYTLTPNLKLDFGYRYLNYGNVSSNSIVCNATPCAYEVQSFKLASHDVRIGLRYMFADYAPPAPPLEYQPPLVRKY